jgi:hypothetical protein
MPGGSVRKCRICHSLPGSIEHCAQHLVPRRPLISLSLFCHTGTNPWQVFITALKLCKPCCQAGSAHTPSQGERRPYHTGGGIMRRQVLRRARVRAGARAPLACYWLASRRVVTAVDSWTTGDGPRPRREARHTIAPHCALSFSAVKRHAAQPHALWLCCKPGASQGHQPYGWPTVCLRVPGSLGLINLVLAGDGASTARGRWSERRACRGPTSMARLERVAGFPAAKTRANGDHVV